MDELWDTYDANRVKTGRTHRRGGPLPAGDYHLVVFVWIRSGENYFITRRAPESGVCPLAWQATGGSALAGEDSLAAALREAKEETGIALRPENGVLFEPFRSDDLQIHGDVWLFRQEVSLDEFVPQPGETIDARLASPEELRAMVRGGETFFALEHIEPLFLFADLLAREEMFICPPPGAARTAIEALLAEDFCEAGASGGTTTREQGIAALVQRAEHPPGEPWRIADYRSRRLSETICLATYTLDWGGRVTRRATIWLREGETWRAAYHQGTRCTS
ncbi:MAG: NUDIX domain-containing protein [Oscillospiraceae bacterium]|jgi:8-oxo-dGTP pyrophosphatase MutT (NUDIX family)|nr:NUDIX domain-containing protein [Oscillospiraceae bacterium]